MILWRHEDGLFQRDLRQEEFRQKRKKSEPVPELFPFTGRELSEDVFEMLIDLFASHSSEQRHDSRCSEHRQDSHVPEARVHTQDRDRARPRKRRVEVSLRTLTREDRDAFTAAKQKEWASWLDKAVGTGEGSVESLTKSHPPCPLGADVEERWNREGSQSSMVRTWISGRAFGNTSHIISDPADGESSFLQWIVNEGHVLESGDLKTAFLSGDPDPAHKGGDSLYIDPPSDLKRGWNLGPEDRLRLRKAVYGPINAPLRWHQKLT